MSIDTTMAETFDAEPIDLAADGLRDTSTVCPHTLGDEGPLSDPSPAAITAEPSIPSPTFDPVAIVHSVLGQFPDLAINPDLLLSVANELHFVHYTISEGFGDPRGMTPKLAAKMRASFREEAK
jgi:hypothetical protein